MKIILASNSPRRRELLSNAGVEFKVIVSNFVEDEKPELSPYEYAEYLAFSKAQSVLVGNGNSIVIGADTIVVKNGEILGKPRDEQHAKEMLKKLSGSEHEVVTGYAVLTSGKKIISHDITRVIFNELSQEFIDNYVKSGSPMDKAGAYGIQDGGLAKSIVGEYDNVVGLPTKKILKALTEIYETKNCNRYRNFYHEDL